MLQRPLKGALTSFVRKKNKKTKKNFPKHNQTISCFNLRWFSLIQSSTEVGSICVHYKPETNKQKHFRAIEHHHQAPQNDACVKQNLGSPLLFFSELPSLASFLLLPVTFLWIHFLHVVNQAHLERIHIDDSWPWYVIIPLIIATISTNILLAFSPYCRCMFS